MNYTSIEKFLHHSKFSKSIRHAKEESIPTPKRRNPFEKGQPRTPPSSGDSSLESIHNEKGDDNVYSLDYRTRSYSQVTESTAYDARDDVGGQTYAYQSELPRLPIPSLEHTCSQYLEIIAPLLTPEEFQETQRVTQEFLLNDGPKLHEKLLEYIQAGNSYVEKFWYSGYLSPDDTVVLNLNPFFVLADDPYIPNPNHPQIKRAASIIYSALRFVEKLRDESLEPDVYFHYEFYIYIFFYTKFCT
eukprot:GSMAST32.ASY1.ANO1.791.1 assembled CDS